MFKDDFRSQVAVPLFYRLENPAVFAEDLIEAQFLPPEDQGCARGLVCLGNSFVDAAEELVFRCRHYLCVEDPIPFCQEALHILPFRFDDRCHLLNGISNFSYVFCSVVFGNCPCSLWFDHHADLENLKHHGRRPVAGKHDFGQFVLLHENTLPVPYLQETESLKHGYGLPEKRARDTQCGGHIPF